MTTDTYSIQVSVDSTSAVTATRNLTAMEQATGRSERALFSLGNMAKAASAALLGIGFKTVISEMASFETKMLQLKSLTDATTQQMKAMEKQARELGATTAFSAQQAAEAQGVLAAAGLKTNEILTATPKVLQLAAAGSLELSRAAEISTETMNGLGLSLKDLGRINDVLAKAAADSSTSVGQIGDAMKTAAPIARLYKISLEEVAAMLEIAAANGLKGAEAGNNLKTIFKALTNDQKDNVEILAKHNLKLKDLSIETIGAAKVLDNLSKAHLSATEATVIYGGDATALGAILANNSEKFKENTKDLEKADGMAKKAADTLNQGLAKAFDSLKGTISEAALQLGDSGLKGALTDVIQQATGVIAIYEGMGDKFAESNNYTKEQYDNLKSVADELKIVAGAAGGIASLTAVIWGANAAMVAFNIATRANPLIMGATVVAAAAGATFAKIADNQSTIDKQIETAEKRIAAMEKYGLPNLIGTAVGFDTEKERTKLTALKQFKEEQLAATKATIDATAKTEKHTEAAKTNTVATADSTDKTKKTSEAKKEAAKAAKDLAEAERYFNEQLNAQVAAAENAGKLFAAQQQTKLAGIEAEKQSIIDKASIEYQHATSYEEKSRILNESQNATNALLAKEKEIRDALTNQSAETIDAKIAAAQSELDNAGKYNLTLAEQLRLKTQISSLQVDKAIIGETASQQDIKAKSDAEKKANDDRLAAIKAIDDAQTAANTASTAQMAILTANLDAAKEAATGLADAFGSVGSAVGGLGVALASYEKSQAAIADGLQNQLFEIQKLNDGKGDQAKTDKAIAAANQKQSQLQVKSYGDMAAAAQGFFKKGTAGYNALGVATKVFRAFEMAQSAMSMVRMIADNGAKVGAYITGLFTQTAANTASVAPNVAADATKATASGTAAVAQASNAPFPIGFATGAAMLAFMLAIGVAMAGGSSSAPTMTGADYEKQQTEKYSASLKTSVLGKDEYSNSIANSLEALKNNSSADLDYSLGMLRAMEKVATSMDTLVSMTAKQLNIDIGQITSSMKFGTSTSSNSPLGSNDLVNLLVFGLFGGFFTKTSVKTEFAGAGIKFIDQTLGSIVTEGIKGAQTYVDVLVTTTKSSFFGMFKSVKQEIKTKYTALSDEIANSISYTIVSMYNAIAIASKQTGNIGIVDTLKGYTVSLGKIPLGKDPTKYEEIFKAAINKFGDDLAMLDPRFKEFQRIGEGYLETLTRTSNGIVTAQQKLAAAGIVAIDYTNIKEKQGDVEAELVRDSILATNSLTDVSDIMSNLSGTADELLAALKNLNDIKFGLNAIGLGSIDLNQKMINVAGGLSAFNSSINDFIGSILSPEDQLNIKTARVASSLESLGITMPDLGGNAQDSLDYYKNLLQQAAQDTTEAGDRAFVKLLQLANDFASVATETAKLAADELNKTLDEFKAKQSEIAATIKTEQGNIVKSTDLLISVYKKLGEIDLPSKEEALRLEREKAAKGLDAESASVTTALNNLTYIINVFNEASAGLKSAYQALTAMRDRFVSIGESLSSYLGELNNTSSDYDNARTLFLKTSELAKGDNEQALKDLEGVSKAFLSASKARSDAEIQAAQDSVNTAKSALTSTQDALKQAQEEQAAAQLQASKDALSNQKQALADQVSALKESVSTITAFKDKLLSVSKSLGSYLKELTNESQNYDAAKAEFLRIAALAKAGDEQALQDLENTAKDFLSISKTQIDDSTKIFKDAIDTSKAGLKTAYDAVVALRDKFKSIRQSLVDYKLEITGAGTPQGSPESIYTSTKKAFEDARVLAAGGNEQALTDLPSIAKSFLDASLQYNATGMDYQADYQSVLGSLDTSIAKVDSQIDILNKQLSAAESADKSLIDLNASALSIDEAIKAYKTALESESQAASMRYEEDKALVIANATEVKANADLQITNSTKQIEQLNEQITLANTQIGQIDEQLALFASATKSLASIDDLTAKVKEAQDTLNTAMTEQSKIDTKRYETDKELVKKNVEDALAKTNEQIDIMNKQLTAAETANASLIEIKKSTDTVWNKTSELAQAVQYYIAADLTKNEFIAANSNLLESIKTSIADSQSAIINANAQAVATAAAQAAEVQRAADAAVQLANANASQAYSDLMDARQANRDAELLAAKSIVTSVNQESSLMTVTPYANGGMASGLSLVGEQGAELINFNSPANVTSHSQTAGLFDSIGNAIDDQSVLLKEQIIELKALVNLQSNANVALINEMQGMKEELNTISRKAKLEAAA
jgi:TP901 family phage tail tape measure protein